MLTPIRIAILASGSGSNAENICNYYSKRPDVDIRIIISNKFSAYVHQRAQKLGIKSITLSNSSLCDDEIFLNLLRENQIDFIILAGYLLRIPVDVVRAYPHRIVNIHPALLPKYGGKGMYGERVHQAVIEAGENESGITIHFVDENYDEGSIFFQATCPVFENDTPDDVAQKVHALEYLHYPAVIDQVLKQEFYPL